MGSRRNVFCIEFKMGKAQAEELKRIYEHYLTSYAYVDEHEKLLAEHIKDMYLRLQHMVDNILKSATLSFNNSEAVAFFQTWATIDTSAWPLANVIICDMLKKIDLRIKAPKKYAH